jgi:hypothetical protein
VRTNADVASMLAGGKLAPGSPMRRRVERAVSPERVPSSGALAPRRAISAADPLGAQTARPALPLQDDADEVQSGRLEVARSRHFRGLRGV